MTAGAGGGVLQPTPGGAGGLDCGHSHNGSAGTLDESARRLSHEELSVAEAYRGAGHDVRSVAESRKGGRVPDLLVCGEPVEVKSFCAAADRQRAPSPQGVFNKLVDGAGQAPHVVLVGGESGLSLETIRRGLSLYESARLNPPGERPLPDLSSVRAMGDGYDLAWARGAGRVLPPDRRPEPGQGLGL